MVSTVSFSLYNTKRRSLCFLSSLYLHRLNEIKNMNPTSPLIPRKILQASDLDAFNGIPETSHSPTTAAAAVRRPYDQRSPFDSSMALTILVLLTALFFLGFFSVYIRRFAAAAEAAAASTPPSRPPRSKRGGLDTSAVKSLPLVSYGGPAKHPMIDDCPICLSEFHERETVKLIPSCSHVFHPRCIDTWLSTHVTCPLCRSSELFKRVEEVCLDVTHGGVGEASTVDNGDTWRHQGSTGVRRACSCSDLGNRAVLQRSSSF